ncbi:mitochondrial DNA helicase [Phlebotomus argentipes]|uniref:mitochondrial DNA helicase n=1 Tax=Phlebotomus argentipes TaxID=94469 RepID=UPI002892C391|nr:mitochondrial DNA helicase [Phlebotomus argentipes]
MLKTLYTRLLSRRRSAILNSRQRNPIAISEGIPGNLRSNFCISAVESGSLLSATISVPNIKRVIKNSGLECEDGFSCIRTVCPVCTDKGDHRESIYINKITGNFTCPACQHLGNWNTIEKFFLNGKTVRNTKEMGRFRENFLNSKGKKTEVSFPDGLNPTNAVNSAQMKSLLEDIGLPTEVETILMSQGAQISSNLNEIFLPLRDVTETVVGYKVFSVENHSERTIPDNNCSGVLMHKPTTIGNRKDSQNAILVLNILDFLTLAVSKINYVIICLPHGLKSLPQQCLPVMERFQKLVLWFNHDSAGWDTARHFAKKLEEKRCLFVRPTEAHPTPFCALCHGLDLKGILSKAEPVLHKAITTFSALRQDVLSDLQNIDKVQGVKWKRYPTLSKLLKGHRKGELTVLTGPTGCGKTTFMSEYSLDLALQGVTTLWGSFEIRNTRLASTLLRQLAGQRLDENLSAFDAWADAFEKLPMYFMTFHGQQPIKVVMEAIEHAQYVHDIHHVIIDNVQFMMGTSEENRQVDRFWRQDAIITAFRTFATRKNSHVTLVIHPRKERDAEDLTTSSIFGSAKASQEADNVLIIQDKRLTSIRGKKYLQVAKNRFSGDLGVMPLEFDKEALSYAQKKKKAAEEKDRDEAIRD